MKTRVILEQMNNGFPLIYFLVPTYYYSLCHFIRNTLVALDQIQQVENMSSSGKQNEHHMSLWWFIISESVSIGKCGNIFWCA
jgi:hypothetical protein